MRNKVGGVNYKNAMRVDSNYIIWFLIASLIFIGCILIVFRDKSKNMEGSLLPLKKAEEKNPDPSPKPPDIIKAVYLTSLSGANEKKIDWFIDLANKSELNPVRSRVRDKVASPEDRGAATSYGINAAVIDVKDFSGYIAYDSGVIDADKYKTERIRIKDVVSLIKQLHDNNIYAIARIVVFQDPALAQARPEWAVKNKYTKNLWHDRNGLAWINPLASESWDYYAAIAEDAAKQGFDEINFDYIRFPSDGDMSAMVFPGWDGKKPKNEIIREFYKHIRESLPNIPLSADLFGFVTSHTDDLGIGQIIEDAFAYFDYVSPMVYPSHYPPKHLKFENPAAHPYEVVYHSMKKGMERLEEFKSQRTQMCLSARSSTNGLCSDLNSLNKAKLRPWLQDFNLGAEYTSAMVESEVKAVQDALGSHYNGFMLWNSKNIYHKSVF